MALLWAAGIIWFAYDVAGSTPEKPAAKSSAERPTDVTGAPISPEDEKKVEQILKTL